MASASHAKKSSEDCKRWMQHVQDVQSKRTPEEWSAAQAHIERARHVQASLQKCKKTKGHAIRSRALAMEGLRQMADTEAPDEHMKVQERWKSAQEASKCRHEMQMMKCSISRDPRSELEQAEVMSDADEEEEHAMAEVAELVGARNVQLMAATGAEGLEEASAIAGFGLAAGRPGGRGSRTVGTAAGGGRGSEIETLLKELRQEPANEEACTAKFLLYENYATEVEQMRSTLLKFYDDERANVPNQVATDMHKQIKGIDVQESMGIPDDAREWFVYHMMRQAERNNLKMAGILDGFEKKLEFLASNDQKECPICLEDFASEGPHMAETLGCCHKVCRDCWDSWSTVTHGRPFCPLCRHDAFLQRVAEEARGMQ